MKLRGTVCARELSRSRAETAPRRLGPFSCQRIIHTPSNSWLSAKTRACRSDRWRAAFAFSSNNNGNTNNGNGVTQARAAASFATCLNALLLRGSGNFSSRSSNNRLLSRSNSLSSVARKGAGGFGLRSNRVSGPNSAFSRLYFVFICICAFVFYFDCARSWRYLTNKKTAIGWQSRVSGNLLVLFRSSLPRCRQRGDATWTAVP